MAGGISQSAGFSFVDDFGGLTGINATPSSTVNTKGSWISMGTMKQGCTAFLFKISYNNNGQADYACSVDIGVGASGSQQAIFSNINLTLQPAGLAQNCIWQHLIPLEIGQGVQVWVRSAINVASFTGTIQCWLTPYDGSFISYAGCSGSETLGVTATGKGTPVTGGTTQTGVKGSYALIGSTTRDWCGFLLNQDLAHNSNNESGNMIDIAIGPTGASSPSQIVLPDLEIYQGGVEAPSDMDFLALPIPAGSTVFARSASIAPANTFGITLYGIFQ
jgi:hypothetical protein